MTDILTDPYIAELRRMEQYIERQLAWLDNLSSVPVDASLPRAEAGSGESYEGDVA